MAPEEAAGKAVVIASPFSWSHHAMEGTAQIQQLLRRALFYYAAVLNDNDDIGSHDSGEAVGNSNSSATLGCAL